MWLAATVVLPGCGGCSQDSADDQKTAAEKLQDELKKAKEKPKPDFEAVKVHIVPQKVDDKDVQRRMVKPGHWTAAVEEAKANNFDFVGQIYAEARADASGKPLELEHTPYRMAVTRPAPMPKGQQKYFDLLFYLPPDQHKAWLSTELRTRGGGLTATPGPEPLTIMNAYQYHMLVLAAEPDRYRLLDKLDSIHAPHLLNTNGLGDDALNYYQVVAPQLKKPLPLPTNMLAWTSIAYLIWDDVDPSLLSLEQQQALVDWIHWGGQLIISGPKSLDQLKDKAFLGNYLPATAGEPMQISAELLNKLDFNNNKLWTLPNKTGFTETESRPLMPVNPWSGVTLKLENGGHFLDPKTHTGELIAERQVGRGRIVVTAFRLTQRELWNWPSFDNFFNACLLRRPPRHFSGDRDEDLGASGGSSTLSVNWANDHYGFADPRYVTQVRFLTHDWDQKHGYSPLPHPPTRRNPDDGQLNPNPYYGNRNPPSSLDAEPSELAGPGIAGWNDFSDTANAARTALREGAGIVVPETSFVVWVLVLYLIVLVPLNWLLFWGLGRVEWAWIAAPIIAIGGMAAVVKLAQLDIGFARSQTELSVLELHNGYPRGHLTRYTALYTSLSTTYDINTDDHTLLVLPFPTDGNFDSATAKGIETVTYHCDPPVQLSDFGVSSNSTSFLHSEQMVDLGGGIDFTANPNGGEISNHTKQNLHRAAVLHRTLGGEYKIGWIGDLPAGRGQKVTFLRPDDFKKLMPSWSFDLTPPGESTPAKLSIEKMADLVRGEDSLQKGETRLVALIEEPLPGFQVDPASSQTVRGATLVVANLESPPSAPPQPDTNTHRDIQNGRPDKPPPDEPDTELPDDEPTKTAT